MFTESDDSSSAGGYSSPEDADYNTSDNEDDADDDDDDEIDLDGESDAAAQKAKSQAVREGFSLMRTQERNASPDADAGDPSWLSTQPPSATKPRRSSPRGKSPGITNAIVGIIRGEATAMENLAIPKKKRFQQHQQQQQEVDAENEPSQKNAPPASHESHQQTQPQQKQPPMKKRKVSLSPTDTLANHRASNRDRGGSEVIDLLADDDNDGGVESTPSRTSNASKANRIAPDVSPKQLSPALLAAAKKQQQEHLETTKQKRHQEQKQQSNLERNRIDDTVNKKETTRPKRTSKVSGVSLANSLPDNKCLENKPTASSCNNSPVKKNKKSRSKIKDDTAPSASSATKSKNKSTAKAEDPKTRKKKNSTSERKLKNTVAEATKEKAPGKPEKSAHEKTIESAASKTNAKGTTTAKRKTKGTSNATGRSPVTGGEPTTTKPPPKKKKKRATFEHELLQKMFLSCRPYSLKELVQLMGKTASEASVNFCLLSLIDKQWVIKKEFRSGSRTKELYWANQECRDKKLWAIDCMRFPDASEIREIRLDLATLQQHHKSVVREIEAVEATPSNERLSVLCQTTQEEVDDLSTRLEAMRGRISSKGGGGAGDRGRPVLGSQRGNLGGRGGANALLQRNKPFHAKSKPKKPTPLQLKKRINAMREQWIKRKRKCMDFVDALADGMEKKVKDVVRKVLELETDEEEGAVLPPKHAV